MTLGQFVEVVRRRHNAEGDSNWSDAEIYQLITNRCNEALPYIGLLEAIDTANSSVAGAQAVALASDAVYVQQVLYKADRLERITLDQWQAYKTDTTTTSGTPTKFVLWNKTVYLVPIPDATGDSISIYYYKAHPYIDGLSHTTIDIPGVLHAHLVNGVVADMFAKDLNVQMVQFYESKWQHVSIPAFQAFKAKEEAAGNFQVLGDSDGSYYY